MSDTPAHRLSPDAASGGVRTGHLDMPVVLLAALDAAGISVDAFLARLTRGSIWQDQAIRSADGSIVIQAYSAPDNLRCVVQIGQLAWYHHPGDYLDVFGADMPDVKGGEPPSRIIGHDLLDQLPVRVMSAGLLRPRKPDFGVRFRLDVPRIRFATPGR